jgi:hypothetical protein
VFSDVGQVFGDADQIALNNLTASYGMGIRVLGSTRYLFRLEVGFSNEQTIFRFRTDQMFQFAKDGLFYGRTPVPAR